MVHRQADLLEAMLERAREGSAEDLARIRTVIRKAADLSYDEQAIRLGELCLLFAREMHEEEGRIREAN